MKAFNCALTTFGILFLLAFRAGAHDSSMPHHEWFNKQEMNPTARSALQVVLRQRRRIQDPLQGW
jgi:hypothetical protein